MSSRRNLVVAQQDEIYVYVSETGHIVIKQEDGMGETTTVVIDPQNAVVVADAVKGYVVEAQQVRFEWLQGEEE